MAITKWINLINKGMSKEDFELTRTFLRSYCKLYAQTPQKQLGF
jgi:zinc protease